MARLPRYKIAGVTQLITQRGNNNQSVFFSDQDYQYYLDILNEAAIKYQCQIHSFVLMSNYIHILATPNTVDGVSQLMKSVGQRYVSYINNIEKRTGTLWDGRYKASLVEEGHYLMACMCYIEMAPVRSGSVKIPKDYRFSSYSVNAQGEKGVVNITPHKSYNELLPWAIDKSNEETRQKYKQLLREQQDEEELQKIHKAINSNLIFGSKQFQESININRV
ncbi:transposase [Candidatus Woesearchaeota archaeon]|jgi:putative transposase|nr:transposase [Candidatus Woesearchaeota archaeon]